MKTLPILILAYIFLLGVTSAGIPSKVFIDIKPPVVVCENCSKEEFEMLKIIGNTKKLTLCYDCWISALRGGLAIANLEEVPNITNLSGTKEDK